MFTWWTFFFLSEAKIFPNNQPGSPKYLTFAWLWNNFNISLAWQVKFLVKKARKTSDISDYQQVCPWIRVNLRLCRCILLRIKKCIEPAQNGFVLLQDQIFFKHSPTINVSFQLLNIGIGSSLTTIFRSSATIAESPVSGKPVLLGRVRLSDYGIVLFFIICSQRQKCLKTLFFNLCISVYCKRNIHLKPLFNCIANHIFDKFIM